MEIQLSLKYTTKWGQTLCVCGSAPELGAWDENNAVEMQFYYPDTWKLQLKLNNNQLLEYRYLLKENGVVIHREWGEPHCIRLDLHKDFFISDEWVESPHQNSLYTSGFTNSFFHHDAEKTTATYHKKTFLFHVICPYANKDQEVLVCGSSAILGGWNPEKALKLSPVGVAKWEVALDASKMDEIQEYKLVIYDKSKGKAIYWEEGSNRILQLVTKPLDFVQIESLIYRYDFINWKASGVAIPVFSLRSNDSFGIGEFSDLKKMIDWASITQQKIIQILPVNDTTITHRWTDSYPYNAISIYALHPIYLGLKDYPLKDKALYEKYEQDAKTLNALPVVDYEKVMLLKGAYINDLYREIGEETLTGNDFADFYAKNESWLFPYACFTYFRDKYQTANYNEWQEVATYDKKQLEKQIKTEPELHVSVKKVFFTQYLLHKQLFEAHVYANKNNVVLKGDIPIGISQNSVEAWVEPRLFNLDTQTGAPPDSFSITGQNWGFPTYNWREMEKDGYKWWKKRFVKMSDYFDVYRIDHILGFFRIWEIPLSSVQGLLGYFSPALPFSVQEITGYGLPFDDVRMTKPYIHEHFLPEIFGEYTQEVISRFLTPIAWQRFELNEACNTQKKIKALFTGLDNEKNIRLRDGLYALCNEVLFIRDKYEPFKYHPRITAQYSYSYKDLDDNAKAAFNRLYNHFFYHRHSQFWREEALLKLPPLISSTRMLVCGEDLGMVPSCVPQVMHELQILSLEIERMPKLPELQFNNVYQLPYMSVCTTSTHDMPPIRLWWKENREVTQRYYNEILWKQGAAPEECTSEICRQIVSNHLNAPSMLTILPLQDWLSIDDKLKHPHPEEERINIPANPEHYWRYRMHLTIEELIEATEFNANVKEMVKNSGRE